MLPSIEISIRKQGENMESHLITVATVGTFAFELLKPLIENSIRYRQMKIMNKVHDQIFEQQYIKSITDKTDLIVPDNFQTPNPSILLPAIDESLLYINEEEIKEMFAKLIASSFDKSKTEFIHPGFIGIIKQLSPLDAKVLIAVKKMSSLQKLSGISLIDNNQREYRVIEMPFNDFGDIKQCALSVDNLMRLGLIAVDSINNVFELSPDREYVEMIEREPYQAHNSISKIANDNNCGVYPVKAHLTVLGEYFLKVCI